MLYGHRDKMFNRRSDLERELSKLSEVQKVEDDTEVGGLVHIYANGTHSGRIASLMEREGYVFAYHSLNLKGSWGDLYLCFREDE